MKYYDFRAFLRVSLYCKSINTIQTYFSCIKIAFLFLFREILFYCEFIKPYFDYLNHIFLWSSDEKFRGVSCVGEQLPFPRKLEVREATFSQR